MRGMKPFEIFRAGNHTSTQGKSLSFSEADLAAIAASYDPAVHHAPIVVGHPKQNGPAFGWIKAIEVKGDRLVAVPEDLDATFAEMVKDKKYRKVSAALYDPSSPGNPTPGSYHLRHVGFLGAEPPAVKGLKAIEFSDAGEIIVEFADTEWRFAWALENVGRLFRGLREHFIETANVETADKVVPAWDIEQLTQSAAELRAENRLAPSPSTFSETTEEKPTMTTAVKTEAERIAELNAREAALNARETALNASETTFSEAAKKARAAEDAAFVDAVVTAGRLPIGKKEKAIFLFSEMSEDVLTFSEAGADVAMSPRAAFRELLENLPIPVVTKELATGDGPDFSDPEQYAAAIQTEIRDAKSKGEEISPAQASARLKNRR